MVRSLGTVVWSSIIAISFSITCNTWELSDQEYSTCTGDACITYIYGGYVRVMGCANNVIFSNRSGCIEGVRNGDNADILCSCQTERCNNFNVDLEIVLATQPKTSCFANTTSKCNGLSCSVAKIENKSTQSCNEASTQLRFLQLQANIIAIDQTSKNKLVERDLSYYLGSEFHANCISQECIDRAKLLRKSGITSNRPQVECHSYSLEDKNNLTCSGDFCYWINETQAIQRGCYTVDDALAERKLTVGHYQYFHYLDAYLCDKKFCNEDGTSARLNQMPNQNRAVTPPPMETATRAASIMAIVFPIIVTVVWMY